MLFTRFNTLFNDVGVNRRLHISGFYLNYEKEIVTVWHCLPLLYNTNRNV